MSDRKYQVGDLVRYEGDLPGESDRGEVVAVTGGLMRVYWQEARAEYDEDPEDRRIQPMRPEAHR